jgi:predicted ferric reductase
MNDQLWWYAARATGLVGWGLCTLSVLWGLTLSTRLLGKRAAPAWLLDLHRFLGGLATIFVAVHLGALVADTYVHLGPAELLVPLASAWKPGPVAWGIAAFYLLVAVEIPSLARRRLPVRVWRMVHMTSLPLWALATVHLLTAGTDIGNPLVQWAVLLSTAAVLFTTLVRVLSPRSAVRKPRAGSGSGGRGPVGRVAPPGPEQGAGLIQGTTGTAAGPGQGGRRVNAVADRRESGR